MKVLYLFLLFVTIFVTFATPTFAQTDTPVPPPPSSCITTGPLTPQPSCAIQVNQRELGFRIPSLSEILTFTIRAFFIIAGLVALVFLLLGALAWITSGGDKENISKAQSKITSAIVGVILIVVVLALIVTLEQVVFARRLCLGLSCPITIPSLLRAPGSVPGTDNGSLQLNDQEVVVVTVTPTPGTAIIVVTVTPTPVPGSVYNQNVTLTLPPGEEIIPNTGR